MSSLIWINIVDVGSQRPMPILASYDISKSPLAATDQANVFSNTEAIYWVKWAADNLILLLKLIQ